MSETAAKDLLRRLCLAAGPPGAEDEVRRIVRDELSGVGPLRYDRLGSVICETRGTSDAPRVVVDSHLDEVAFMVQSISAEGRVAFVALGGWWEHVLLGQRVEVLAEGRRVQGVIGAKPPHFLAPEERKKVLALDTMYVDLGAGSRDEVESLGVRIGDPIVPHAEFLELGSADHLSCKAFDNRAGVGLMCETLRAVAGTDHPNTVVGVGAVQEELGCRGAVTSSELTRGDVAVILECTPADDLPGFTEPQAVLGRGPQIRHFDPTAVSNRSLVRLVQQVADETGVPVQMAVRRSGGTDAGQIHLDRSGVPTVVIGVPARYIHTHVGVLHWQDYLAARRLLPELIRRLDAETVGALTRFD